MTPTRCHLTAKNSAYLKSLLTVRGQDGDYLALLRQKLETADVRLDHAIDPRVATLGSRVEFSIGGGVPEERVLTRNDNGPTPSFALPVTTSRGLALLGLTEGDVFALRKPNGIIEPIRLIKVVFQPEADERGASQSDIVEFHPRWRKSLGGAVDAPPGNDDPDPGPNAA